MESAKIVDFGLSIKFSTNIQKEDGKFEKVGTMIYMAPELIKNKRYSLPVDIWSCGLILYWIITTGNHALYERKKDNEETYQVKLENP